MTAGRTATAAQEEPEMTAEHEDHGNTPAAWTAAIIIMIAFVIGAIAVLTANWALFWIGGVGGVILGGVVGKVMAMMGMGKQPA
jgi:hypothetical protein